MKQSQSPFAQAKNTLTQLKQLKHQLQAEKIQPSPTPNEAENPDADLWAKAIADVKPINNTNQAHIQPIRQKPTEQILARRAAAVGQYEHDDDTILSDTQARLNPISAEQSLSYRIRTLQNSVFDDLKSGKLAWFEAVDLHGCTVEQARTAVLQIIQMAKDENQTVLKIVHGKGGANGLLKTYVNSWLRQHPDVLAFVSAPNNQGGSGAVLVLIKRSAKRAKNEK